MRATKLVCTIGPATVGLIPELIGAGMDVARLNLSHGTREEHEKVLETIREESARIGRLVGVMADLSGPKVRLGEIRGGEAILEEGQEFVLRGDDAPGNRAGAATNHPGLADDLAAGDRLLLADGDIELEVGRSGDGEVLTRVVRAGVVRSGLGVNVPAARLKAPAITTKDEEDLRWAEQAGVDIVAQSFVRRAEEVRALRSMLADAPMTLIAKIETGAALQDLDRILEDVDGLMVARGDLGVEVPLEEIPVIQRELVRRAKRLGVPVIVATQMLESMTESPRPTRAEASDVATAVFEGVDAILLSAETAIGSYPVEATQTAARIATVAEKASERTTPGDVPGSAASDAHAIAHAAATVAAGGEVAAIACFTRTGLTARVLSAVRPPVPVFAFSPDVGVLRRLSLYRGVTPLTAETPESTDAMIELMDASLRESGLVREGEAVVMVASSPFGKARTNLLKIERIGG
ncbi:MAG: pyruvate kinase [Actinomycetota bacterium]